MESDVPLSLLTASYSQFSKTISEFARHCVVVHKESNGFG